MLKESIGRGGMGSVYLAYEAALDRTVAIKFITATAPGRAARERFLIEARAVARLQHPNVVAIYRIGEVEGRPYIASEYVAGKSVDRLPKPMPWPRALHIVTAVARGLAEAHRRGVLHRDIKPANVIDGTDGVVKLLDFGLAKLEVPVEDVVLSEPPVVPAHPEAAGDEPITMDPSSQLPWEVAHSPESQATVPMAVGHSAHGSDAQAGTISGAVLGTPLFVAPELWSGAPATARSDVYATGLLAYELCAGTLPFAHLSGRELVHHVRRSDLPPLLSACADIPRAFANLVDRAVRREATERFATANELLEALEAVSAVFQSFRRVSSDTPGDDASLVSASFANMSPRVDAFFASVYEELFAREPALRALFPVDLVELRAKLASTVRLAVESLRAPERLVPILEDLGRRHVNYGVFPKHLRVFGAALLTCLERFHGDAWDPATAAAWGRAYDAIAQAMEQGMRSITSKAR